MIKELYQTVEQDSHKHNYTSVPISSNNGHKAVILSAGKWSQLLNIASGKQTRPQTAASLHGEKTLPQKEAEFKQYLKNESQAMTRKWKNTVQNIRENKEAERIRKQRERVEEDEKHYRELKAADEIKRNELIQKAEEMIQKGKEGPRILESAAKFCEVLKIHEHQRMFRIEQENLREAQRKQLDLQDNAQANRWIKSQVERHVEDRKRFDSYKKELKEKIEQDREEQQQRRNHMIELERKQHQALVDEVEQKLDEEKRKLERNKEIRRQHALEAMRMAHEREERLKREAQIEETLNQIYNDGQKTLADKRKEIHLDKHKFRDNRILLRDVVEKQQKLIEDEIENYKKAIQEKEKEADKKEREKIDYGRQLKAARIQAHLEEVEWQKRKENEQAILERKEMADRVKNINVTFGFDQQKVTNKTAKTHAHRKLLLDQIDERESREKMEADTRAELQYMQNSAEKENRHFLSYADELISDARAKGRPVLPLLKTVENYKREHYFDFKEKNVVPRHLISRVPVNNKLAGQQCGQYIPDPAIIEMTPSMPPIRVRYDPEQLRNMNPYKSYNK